MSVFDKPLTGRKVFLIVLAGFAVVIAANLFLAVSAITTNPGLEVKNGYIASQQFERRRQLQESLAWKADAQYRNGFLVVEVIASDGRPAELQEFEAAVRRPTHGREDRMPTFKFSGQDYSAPVDLAKGRWNIDVKASSSDGRKFEQRLSILIR